MRRALAFGLGLLVLAVVAVAVGGVAVGRGTPSLRATGPTSVSGTDATAVFGMGERTVRQVRYADRGTLRYTFAVANHGRLDVRLLGLAADQQPSRLFTLTGLTPVDLPAGGSAAVTLILAMSGCEHLSSRAGSFVTEVAVRTRTAGVFDDVVVLRLPEELHTGSAREAFCPRATATSRPPG